MFMIQDPDPHQNELYPKHWPPVYSVEKLTPKTSVLSTTVLSAEKYLMQSHDVFVNFEIEK